MKPSKCFDEWRSTPERLIETFAAITAVIRRRFRFEVCIKDVRLEAAMNSKQLFEKSSRLERAKKLWFKLGNLGAYRGSI